MISYVRLGLHHAFNGRGRMHLILRRARQANEDK